NDTQIDSSNFELFGLFDIIADTQFLSSYKSAQNVDQIIDPTANMTNKELKKYNNKHRYDDLRIGESHFIVMEPWAISRYKNRKVDNVRSESYEVVFDEAYLYAAEQSSTSIHFISAENN